MPVLIVLAVCAGVVGLFMASQATVGVAFVGVGCLLAILARIAQAGQYQRATLPQETTTPPVTPERARLMERPQRPASWAERLAWSALGIVIGVGILWAVIFQS
jgi:hypothetical protein